MSAARWWTELVADLADRTPGGVAGLAAALLLLAGLVVTALYWRPKLRPATAASSRVEPLAEETDGPAGPEPTPDDEVPEVPAVELLSLADRYAREGRYAEAVRERLRAMVRELVERGVLAHRPGWTVTELADTAGRALPAVGGALAEAAGLFSDLWYGDRPATAGHDDRMRALAAAVSAAVPGTVSAGAARPVEVRA